MKLRDAEARRRKTGTRKRERERERAGEQGRLIITFDRNYGNETANYKKGLQAAPARAARDFLLGATTPMTETTAMPDA
jgi:hypothetical protein